MMAISLKFYRIFIPQQYNSGEPVEPEKLLKIANEVGNKFKAYSASLSNLPIIEGLWTSEKDGKKYAEPMMLLELFVEDTFKNKKWLKAFKEMIAQELEQEEIFIIVQDAEILRD